MRRVFADRIKYILVLVESSAMINSPFFLIKKKKKKKKKNKVSLLLNLLQNTCWDDQIMNSWFETLYFCNMWNSEMYLMVEIFEDMLHLISKA